MATKYKKFYVYKPSTYPDTSAKTDNNMCDFADGAATVWLDACVVDVSFDGSWEEEDVTDSCSLGIAEASPTIRNAQIDFDAFKKEGTLPAWYTSVRDAWELREPIALLMVDDLRTVVGADGVFMLANIFDFKLSHPTKGANKVEFTAKVAGTITAVEKFRTLTRV